MHVTSTPASSAAATTTSASAAVTSTHSSALVGAACSREECVGVSPPLGVVVRSKQHLEQVGLASRDAACLVLPPRPQVWLEA